MMAGSSALIADDDEFFRQSIEAILRKRFGFSQVVQCGSLDDAVEALGSHERISVALFDLMMPGMDSPANLKAVRECFPDLRVVVVSASEQRSDILRSLEVGVHGYISKRLGVSKLTEALELIQKGHILVPTALSEIGPDEIEAGETTNTADADPAGSAEKLTPRQRQVMELLVMGKSNKEIARALKLGEGTVKVHMAALFRTLGVNSRSRAAALGAGLLRAP